ncbi:hypothetical protein DL96DRAFT_101207 [Flagelloscypha sp. PMI_526]|nr:hypothetical protein DL96DRAFT_101207 [Flagelloscypha sp. PMI_526]
MISIPFELVREIVETAAYNGTKSQQSNLTVISKLVQTWVDPILYHTVIFKSRITPEGIRALSSRLHTSTLSVYIFKVFLDLYDDEILRLVLPQLHSLQDLWIGRNCHPREVLRIIPSLPSLKLHHFAWSFHLDSYNLKQVLGKSALFLHQSSFSNLTHLFLDYVGTWAAPKIVNLALFPSLTHLAVYAYGAPSLLLEKYGAFLNALSNTVKVFLLLVKMETGDFPPPLGIIPEKNVVIFTSQVTDMFALWGGMNELWHKAEVVLRERH